MQDPAGTIDIMESAYNSEAADCDPGSYITAARHNGGWNVTFCDGHGKWMKPDNSYMWGSTIYPSLQSKWFTLAAD